MYGVQVWTTVGAAAAADAASEQIKRQIESRPIHDAVGGQSGVALADDPLFIMLKVHQFHWDLRTICMDFLLHFGYEGAGGEMIFQQAIVPAIQPTKPDT